MLFRSDRKSTRLNSSHTIISYAVFCLKKKALHLVDPALSSRHEARRAPPPALAAPGVARPVPGRPPSAMVKGVGSRGALFFFFINPAPPDSSLFPQPAPSR